jgi:hypothetical protein
MEERIQRMIPMLDERQKRLFLANEALSYGRGGISLVSRISGMSRTTIHGIAAGATATGSECGNTSFSSVDRTGLEVQVSHFPPGTSKWNKVEHRLFCYITKNWQGKPLVDVQTAVDLIGATRTTTGLEVICVRDDTEYCLAKKVSDEEFATIHVEKIAPFALWNYRILPR